MTIFHLKPAVTVTLELYRRREREEKEMLIVNNSF